MKIEISNQQQKARLDLKKTERLMLWLMEQVSNLTHELSWHTCSLVLTDHEGIIPVNQSYFGKQRETDVISLNYEPMPGDDGSRTCEIIVNVQRALEVGPDHDGIDRELALYMAHGCLHLSGATDDTHDEKMNMRKQELKWLEEAHTLGYIEGIISA